jgi:nucleoid-associated protein YgaU
MARVIVILGLMIAITATMFWITRKPPVATDAAATPATTTAAPSTTVSLAELTAPKTSGVDEDLVDKPDDTQSPTSAEPRLVTNPSSEVQSAPASAQDVTSGAVSGAAPTIGLRSIDKRNNGTFSGTASPGDAVSLMWDEKSIAWTTAASDGAWTIEFKAPDLKKQHELYVVAKGKDGVEVRGPQRVVVGPPVIAGGEPAIEVAMADLANVTAAAQPVAPADEPMTAIVVEKTSGGEAGLVQLAGRADPGATLKVEINGKAVGETVVGTDGAWSFAGKNESGRAADTVQLKLVRKDGKTLDDINYPYKVASAETKLADNDTQTSKDAPAVLTSKPIADGAAAAMKSGVGALFEAPPQAVVEKPKTQVIRVRRGDSLWRIAKRHLGNGKKWSQFYRLNKRKIDNPDLIYPGQTLILPG